MKKMIILLTIAALVCLTFTAMAAGDGIAFDTSITAINEGDTLQTVLTREGAAAEGEITYTSSSPKTATVDENGLVTAVKKGPVVITAAVKVNNKNFKAQLKLNILRPVTGITVNTAKLPVYPAGDEKVASLLTVREDPEENELPVLLLPVKKKYALTVQVEPKDASDRNVSITSSDENVFTAVKSNISGIGTGEAILTAASVSNPDVADRYRVLVIQPVTKLTVETSVPTVTVGETITATAQFTPENASIRNVIWSGDGSFAAVDGNGIVTGLKHGNGRIIATAADGSGIRANMNIKVVQNPESITLSASEITVAVGRNTPCRATVEPKDADDKKVIWSSSDENIATVDKTGRITGKAIGDCTITCTSEALDSVSATLTVHVVQPVVKLSFNSKTALVYLDETTQLDWTIEPDNATNKTLTFKSAKESIASVDENGVVTGVSSGKTTVTASTTDGSQRKASIAIHAGKHVTGVQMIRRHAYIDAGETATAGANIEPRDALNNNMTWESSNTYVVTASGNTNHKMKLTGINHGDAVVTGTTEDGGFQTSIKVTVGEFDKGVIFSGLHHDNTYFWLDVKNNSNFVITQVIASLAMYNATDGERTPLPINTRTGSNTVDLVWNGTLRPGETTGKGGWQLRDFRLDMLDISDTCGTVTVYEYQIDNDWVKTIRTKNRTTRKYGY